ncbi:MAG: L,D-transpeptidase [Polyangiales bacterium]
MSRTKLRTTTVMAACAALALGALACSEKTPQVDPSEQVDPVEEPEAEEAAPDEAVPEQAAPEEPPPPELLAPVDLWRDGKPAGRVDAQGADARKYVFFDLGEGWTPVLFSDGADYRGNPKPHKFRPTYLALARGEFPDDAYGERAQEDKYLELYGIMPTLSLLRERLTWARKLSCQKQLDPAPLLDFTGVITYQGPVDSVRNHKKYVEAEEAVRALIDAEHAGIPELLDPDRLDDKQLAQLKLYLDQRDDYAAIVAAQDRLACEGYLEGKGKWVKGAFDWATHEALAEFERRHRVYSWGAMGAATLAALRMDTAQTEVETVIRVLTERAMHAFEAIEDGSAERTLGQPVTYQGADGQIHQVPNLEAQLREAVIQHFGLHDAARTAAFLAQLGTLPADEHHYLAIPAPARPEYHGPNMDLTVGIDRGDVWYEFPFDEQGRERSQSVSRRPRTNLYVNYLNQKILIASFGTTIGGWKSELIEGSVWWKYKQSPPGEVIWREVVSAPVWLPPPSTPPRDLLRRRKHRKPDEPKWEPNYHETGPSYASAYGLVAAYHRLYERTPEGTIRAVGDDGIRSHGSVDYMSIMRRHSHGCHRLHNHLAERLFSFVVAHRPHQRWGHAVTDYVLDFEYDGEPQQIDIKEGGYVFKLEKPIFVTVEEGRIKGKVMEPIETPIPKFNTACKGYYLPDGGVVTPKPDGTLVASAPLKPDCDAGLPAPVPRPSINGVPVGDPNLVNTSGVPPAAQTPPEEKLGPGTP